MEDGRIQNSQLTASSENSELTAPAFARLNQPAGTESNGCWRPLNNADPFKWIQVDLLVIEIVTGIILQGRGDPDKSHWTTNYKVQFSDDATSWTWEKDVNQQNATVSLHNGFTFLG